MGHVSDHCTWSPLVSNTSLVFFQHFAWVMWALPKLPTLILKNLNLPFPKGASAPIDAVFVVILPHHFERRQCIAN